MYNFYIFLFYIENQITMRWENHLSNFKSYVIY